MWGLRRERIGRMGRKGGLGIRSSDEVSRSGLLFLVGFSDAEVKDDSNGGTRSFMFFVTVLPRAVLPPVLTMSQEQSSEPVLPIGQEEVLPTKTSRLSLCFLKRAF